MQSDPGKSDLAGGLYIVASPIGNLGDLTDRARRVLAGADVVACEDTRVTGRLMSHLGVSTRLFALHDHNEAERAGELADRIEAGASVALISDAGTPGVSDPGYKLVRLCRERDLPVTALPGPSAVINALVLSGLPTDRFLFAGFPPAKSTGRRKFLAEWAATPSTLVFFESARRLADSLADMHAAFGDREAAVLREMTKLYEECVRGRIAELAERYAGEAAPKGEIVIVVDRPGAPAALDQPAVDAMLSEALQTMSVRDAARSLAERTGMARQALYRRALELTRSAEDE